MDWLEGLDLKLALRNCHNDILGDWYRDPWGWPEMDWAVSKRPDVIVARLNSSGSRRVARLDVAKENFGIRPAVVLDPIDRIIYQALVDSLSRQLIGEMPNWVYGWRLPQDRSKSGSYSRNDRQWTNFTSSISDAATSNSYMLKTDIVSFFSSISVPLLVDRIYEAAGHDEVTERLASMLFTWDKVPERRGLPQRSAASAVLANMYLSPVDGLLANYMRSTGGSKRKSVFRWMDDIWVFGKDESSLRDLQIDLQREFRRLSLEMNIPKTGAFAPDEAKREIDKLDFTGLDYLLSLQPINKQALNSFNKLLDQVTNSPEQANRTTIKFVTTRMRWHELFGDVSSFVDISPRMPQGADSLARLFRDSGVWRDLVQWYLSYASGPWGKIDWSVAQLGTMFATNGQIPLGLEEYFSVLLTQTKSLAMTALCAQRLAASADDSVRYTLREAATLADHPMHRRILALAALQAGEPRFVVRRILSEFEENSVTLEMLEDRSFRPIRPSADFTGRPGRSK